MNRIQNGHPAGSERPQSEASANTSDAELVQAARRGDKRSFVEIVARHQAMVCGIALGILGDFAASEDAGQEAFLTAWRKIHELREPEKLRAWLSQIARNAALGQLRRRRGHESLDAVATLPDDSPLPDAATASEEEASLVRESLAKLPEMYRLPLVLYYREGQSVRAVADALELSEDAVKQRLARGREMLRERMSGMVETVLTRTKPNAIFTMAIAVAIGALAAPSALAAAAFAAGATATATTASSGASTSIVSIMSTTKAFVVTTAVVAVLCIPVGYKLAASKPTTDAVKREVIVETKPAVPPEEVRPSFENSVLFAEWQELHDMHGRTAEAMPAILKAIDQLKDPFRRRAFRTALVAEWVQLDPTNGLKFFFAKGADSGLRRQFFQEWLALNAPAAIDALMAMDTGWENTARESLPEIARRVPARVAEIVARLPAAESYWDANVRDAFAILAEGGLSSARQIAEGITGPNREQALAGVARAWAKVDFEGAVAWAKGLPDGIDRNEIIRVALMGKASVDPTVALDSVTLVPPGGKYAYFATSTGARVLTEAAKADFDATMAWMAAHPGRLGHEDLMGLAHPVAERLNEDVTGFLKSRVEDGSFAAIVPAIENAMLNDAGGQRSAIWEWLKTQPESDAVKSLKDYVLSSAGYQDPQLALRLASELPKSPELDSQLQTLARSLFNGGSALSRFDNLYAQAPERMREPLLKAAFDVLRAETMGDPQRWIALSSQLPENLRMQGMVSIARAWAEKTPEEAVSWAGALPVGEARSGALAAIASSWAANDAHGAADWVNTLSPGPERDRSVDSLVTAMADKYPREAWEWAQSIREPAQNATALTHVVTALARRDANTARQWIDAGPFTPDLKAKLQLAVENRGKMAAQ